MYEKNGVYERADSDCSVKYVVQAVRLFSVHFKDQLNTSNFSQHLYDNRHRWEILETFGEYFV